METGSGIPYPDRTGPKPSLGRSSYQLIPASHSSGSSLLLLRVFSRDQNSGEAGEEGHGSTIKIGADRCRRLQKISAESQRSWESADPHVHSLG
jgi:hypothetical protein